MFDVPGLGSGSDLDSIFGGAGGDQFGLDPLSGLGSDFLEPPMLFPQEGLLPAPDDGPLALEGEDLQRFTFRLDQSLERARDRMRFIHSDARLDRQVYRQYPKEQDYEGQPNLTTPISANKADGLKAQMIDAMEQRPHASFVAEGVGKPAERAVRAAPLCAAYLEREINRGGSREILIRGLTSEAVVVGTGISKLAMVQHPSGEWFAGPTRVIQIEDFYVDRIKVPNLKHCFSAYEERIPYYQLQEMADQGLVDSEAVEKLRMAYAGVTNPSETEKDSGFYEGANAFQEETAIHEIYYCYMRFRARGAPTAELYEAVWSRRFKVLLAVRLNPVRAAFDHPPIGLARIGKEPGHLFGRGIMRRLATVQVMADQAINAHLAVNQLAASPPFVYKMHSPFGKFLESNRRILPGVGIPSNGSPDSADVKLLEFRNPGLALDDVGVAQTLADRGTFTEEAIGATSARKTLGQFRVEMQRGTMRIHLDLGDFAYDMSQLLTMMWSMMIAYKVVPSGVVEVEEGGKFLGAREIGTNEIAQVMDEIIMTQFNEGAVQPEDMIEFEREFNDRLTDDIIPNARRSDLTIHLTGTKIIADKATELEMLVELTPFILQGLELAKQDTYFNYHLRSLIESMGFRDIEKRMPPDPGVAVDGMQRQALGDPLAQTIQQSSNMV